jgi:hypothetical protein
MAGAEFIGDWLHSFNRKERYFLVKQALGGFSLDPNFRKQLSDVIGSRPTIAGERCTGSGRGGSASSP